MTPVRFLSQAEEEMVEAADYYDAEADGLGDRFLDDVQHTLNLISGRPEIGTKVSGSLRRVLCRRFPFSVIYAIEPDTITIVAVAHQRRRPEYWRENWPLTAEFSGSAPIVVDSRNRRGADSAATGVRHRCRT